MTCKDNCPVVVKHSLLGCNGRPICYQNECPRLKNYYKEMKMKMKKTKKNKCKNCMS